MLRAVTAACVFVAAAVSGVSAQGIAESKPTLSFFPPSLLPISFSNNIFDCSKPPATGGTAAFPINLSMVPLCNLNASFVLSGQDQNTRDLIQYLSFGTNNLNYATLTKSLTNTVSVAQPFCYGCQVNRGFQFDHTYNVTLKCVSPPQCVAPLTGIVLQEYDCQDAILPVYVPPNPMMRFY